MNISWLFLYLVLFNHLGAVTATGDSIVQPLLSTPSQTGEQVEAVEPEVPESEFQTLPNDMIRPADDDNDEDEAF